MTRIHLLHRSNLHLNILSKSNMKASLIHLSFFVLSCWPALSSPNDPSVPNQSSRRSKSRSKSRSQSPAPTQHSRSPSPDQPSAPDSSNTNNNNNNNNTNYDDCQSIIKTRLLRVCAELGIAVTNAAVVSRETLLDAIKALTYNNMSLKDFINEIESQFEPPSSSSSSKSRARFSSKSRSRSKHRSPSSHHHRSSKSNLKSNSSSSNNSSNNNNDDAIDEDKELQPSSSSSSSSHAVARRSRSRSRSSRRSRHSSSSSSRRRRRSKSRSRSRSRSSRHRRHKSRSRRRSSRSRSRSRSPSRRRRSSSSVSSSSSRSRSRSSSPPRQSLSVPDPLQPDFKPLSNKTMKELEKGNFVHFNKLIRQLALSSNPVDNRHETRIGDGLVLSSSHRPKLRHVDNSLDWFEVCFSSIMPSMAQQIMTSTSITDAHTIATTLQQHICYALHAVTLFRQNPASFSHVFKYLESHRETSVNQRLNVAEPNALLLQKLHQCIMSASNSSNSRSSSSSSSAFSNSSSSSSSSTASHSSGSGRNKTNYGFVHCGNFNSRGGCKLSNCKYPHICRECKSLTHNKTTCPAFKLRQEAQSKSKSTNSK